jgi:hypothetical protein
MSSASAAARDGATIAPKASTVRGRGGGLAPHLALADLKRRHLLGDGNPRPRTARVPDRARPVLPERREQHLAALVLVGRRHHGHVRDAAQVRQVERAVMRRAVGPDQAAAIEREHDRQVLQGNVVDQLVVGALQERRVDRDDRLHAVAGEAGRERHRVLFCDAHVEVALRVLLLEAHQPGTLAHRGSDPDETLVGGRHVAQPVAEDLRVGRLARGGLLDADARVELAGPVVQDRVGLGELVALALLGHDVQELRPVQLPDVLQRRDQRFEVVAVDRADVVEPELLEQRAGHDHALGVLLEPARQGEHRREVLQHLLAGVLGRRVELAAEQAREVAVEPADRRRDRHVVVVQDHQQADVLGDARVVQRLEGHAGAHRAVADHRDRVALRPLVARGDRHAERRRDRRRRVRGAERVELALRAAREARDPAVLPQVRHALAPAGEDLVRVGLVADVPHQAIVGRVEHVMQRDGQLDRAEVRAEMSARLRDRLQQVPAQFDGQLLQLGAIESPQVSRRSHALEQFVHPSFHRFSGSGTP